MSKQSLSGAEKQAATNADYTVKSLLIIWVANRYL